MIQLLACLFILVCYKWGDWRNWKTYYPTILFLIAGTLFTILLQQPNHFGSIPINYFWEA